MQHRISATFLAGSIALLACEAGRRPEGTADTAGVASPSTAQSGGTATAAVRDASGKDLGTLTLRDSGGRIALSGELTGLPRGTHAIHLHTVGKCEGPKFESAGSHWNPTSREHGTQNPNGPHLGDFPNLTAGADGPVQLQNVSPGGTLKSANPLLDTDGASVVVHAKADDYKTDPSGNSGDRIACGVVGQ
jgi:Cu-Zn family superoxide dismutase